MAKRHKINPPKGERTHYEQLWRVVDGAVRDAIAMHPDYINRRATERTVRNSIVKRVTGAVSGFAVQAARGRSLKRAADNDLGAVTRQGHVQEVVTSATEGGFHRPPSQ